MIASPQPKLSIGDYLKLEEKSSTKHEYINGEAYAMAGATDTHVTIAGNMFALLRSHLRGSGCRVYISDMKAQIESRNCFYYPDVMVTCDERDRDTSTYKRYPKLIVEVLSDSTEAFDRGDKFADYQTLESLEEYVLINTRHQRVECFRRGDDGTWVLHYYPAGVGTTDASAADVDIAETGQIELRSVDFRETLAALYEDVVLEPSPVTPLPDTL